MFIVLRNHVVHPKGLSRSQIQTSSPVTRSLSLVFINLLQIEANRLVQNLNTRRMSITSKKINHYLIGVPGAVCTWCLQNQFTTALGLYVSASRITDSPTERELEIYGNFFRGIMIFNSVFIVLRHQSGNPQTQPSWIWHEITIIGLFSVSAPPYYRRISPTVPRLYQALPSPCRSHEQVQVAQSSKSSSSESPPFFPSSISNFQFKLNWVYMQARVWRSCVAPASTGLSWPHRHVVYSNQGSSWRLVRFHNPSKCLNL